MDYKHKYLKYKQKYNNLQNLLYHTRILSGGGLILPWFPMRSNQLYIEAIIDPVSYLGTELNFRLTQLGIAIPEFHISLLEILVPEMRQNIGPGKMPDNPIDLFIKSNIQGMLKINIRDIYNETLSNLLAYSARDNYDCYGNFFIRKYDDIQFARDIINNFKNFKIRLISVLLQNSSFSSDFNTLIYRPLVKLISSSDPSRPPVIRKEFTHYYQKSVPNSLRTPCPSQGSGENTSLFAISEYFNTTDIDPAGGLIGWIPHISITNDITACSNKVAFMKRFQLVGKRPNSKSLSYLPMWKSSVSKQRPDDPTKTMYGSISKLIIKYAGITEEINL
jgi:hypothetical protein